METLKYTKIKSVDQYNTYCDFLENLIVPDKASDQDEIELLSILIEKWDEEHNSLNDLNPIELLKALMAEHNLKAKDLVEICGLTKGTVSKILNYQKGLSKDSIRILSNYFKVSQEAFNRHYVLKKADIQDSNNLDFIKMKKKRMVFAH